MKPNLSPSKLSLSCFPFLFTPLSLQKKLQQLRVKEGKKHQRKKKITFKSYKWEVKAPSLGKELSRNTPVTARPLIALSSPSCPLRPKNGNWGKKKNNNNNIQVVSLLWTFQHKAAVNSPVSVHTGDMYHIWGRGPSTIWLSSLNIYKVTIWRPTLNHIERKSDSCWFCTFSP